MRPLSDPNWKRLSVRELRKAIRQFPFGTARAADNVSIRAYDYLPDDMLEALADIFHLCELLGRWPEQWDLVLICLLVKKDGGYRPIGLFPSPIRI